MKTFANNVVVAWDGNSRQEARLTGEIEYEFIGVYTGPVDRNERFTPKGVMITSITSDRLPEDITFPVFGKCVDCGSGMMTQLYLTVTREGNITASGHCASVAYYDKVVRKQVLESGAEKFQKSLREHDILTGGNCVPFRTSVPQRAKQTLAQFQ